MNKVSISALALVATMASAGAAQAQNFDGPSVGVQAGWTQNKLRNPTTDLGVTAIDANKDSATFGIDAGYDKEFGKFVLGAAVGLSFGTDDTISGGSGANILSIDPKRSLDLTLRAGYLLTPATLVYARGGYANERINTTLTTANVAQSLSENRDGWLAGAGVERMLTDHVSARVEYRYSDFSNGDGKYDRHQVLTGISYRF